MMQKVIKALVSGLVMYGIAAPATGWALSQDEAENFIQAMPKVQELGDAMETEGKNVTLRAQMKPQPGKPFHPYTSAVAALSEHYPDDYDALEDVIEEYDFDSPEEWAEVGDAVMKAYVAINMEGTPAPVDMANMNPEMMAMLPPAAKAQMQQASAMMKTMRNAPEEDKAIIRPLIGALEQNMK